MSRIGKKPIEIPPDVEAKIEGQKVIIKGPRGELSKEIRPEIKVEVREGKIFVSPQIETKQTKALWGLSRALISRMIDGVTKGFEKKLEIEGLGFRAQVREPTEGGQPELELFVGFSHPVRIKAPEGIKFLVEKNIITVLGVDLEKVSQIAAKIRKVKPPEPYKGKGIRYLGEVIKRKVGKKVVAATK
jgi:large subunit ribosomal protein L6